MKNILEEIVQFKKEEVNRTLSSISKEDLYKKETDTREPLDFRKALQAKGLSIISEVKKASPSKGLIRPDFQPLEIALAYRDYGANCISILTEEKYFQGSPEYLKTIRKNVQLPLIRKDFMVDERQIRESYDMGADAILLIVACLKEEELHRFNNLAHDFGLTCLVEVHTGAELRVALDCQFDLIGINNRDLTTFTTSLNHSIELKKLIPPEVVTVSESGIATPADCQLLLDHGFDAILVGETLMRQENPGKAIHQLLGKSA